MADSARTRAAVPPASPYVHALRLALRSGATRKLATFSIGELNVEVARTTDPLWLLIRRPGRGGLALRAACVPEGAFECRRLEPLPDETLRFEIESVLGRHVVRIVARDGDLPTLRLQTSLEPAAPLLVPFLPRDLYPLGRDDDPLAAGGNVEAAQRGVNAGLLYFTMNEPKFGSVFYFQNLTSLNDYYRATRTKARRCRRGRVAGARLSAPHPTAERNTADGSAAGRKGDDDV